MEPPPEETMNEFLFLFQKLVILDYIIRNTGTLSLVVYLPVHLLLFFNFASMLCPESSF